MREILFRGKTDKGEWVRGVPFLKEERCYIIEDLFVCDEYDCTGAVNTMVIPETIGQYTGLTSKSGAMVFEGDVVQVVYDTRRYGTYVVAMSKERGGWFPFACGDGCGCCECDVERAENCEIIGNVYDNPELLEKEDAEWVEL